MPLEIVSFKQLLSLPDDFEWLIDGIAPEIGTGFIAGKFSVGKSWITQSLVLSVATGKKWLGKFPVKQGVVLVIDEENAQPLITKRMKQLCEGMGINQKVELPIFYAIKSRMNFSVDAKGNPSRTYNDLCNWAVKHKPVLVLSDSLTRIHTNNEDKSYEMRPVFENIDKFCQKFQTCSLFTHHSGHDGDRMRGSVDIYGASDWSLFIKSTGKGAKREITVTQDRARWAAAIEPFNVKMKATETSFKVTYDGQNDQELDKNSQQIVDALKNKGERLVSEVLAELSFSQSTYYRVRNVLVNQGLVVEGKIGKETTIFLKDENHGFSPRRNGHKK